MLLVKSVGLGVVGYFLDGRDPGRWSPGAGRLLGLEGQVDRRDLVAVLRGRHPGSGQFLPATRRARRRAGWDLIFAAPKSVSLVAATSDASHPVPLPRPAATGDPDPTVAGAHGAAVDGVLAWLDQRLTVAHHATPTGEAEHAPPAGPFAAADGLIAASFTHVRNAAGEPHLHTHVLVANLTRADGTWWAARGEDWFVNRSAAGALYQLELRHHLRAAGWDLEWRLRPDGLADLAGVPRAAVRAASSQAAQVAVHGRYEARRAATVVPWRARAAAAGFTGISPTGARAGRDDGGGGGIGAATERAVTARLGAIRSDFRRADVIVALAACHPGGATVGQVDEFVERICASARAVPSPTTAARWSTAAAARLDDQLERLLDEMARAPVRVAAPALGGVPVPGVPGADRRAADAIGQVLSAPVGVVHLGAPVGSGALLAQAEVLDACRAAWAAAGLTAGVDCPPDAVPRWAVLSGLDRVGRGLPPDVVVVDRADRRTTAELLRIAETARSSGSRLVLVHGGTMPRVSAPVSRGLAAAAGAAGRLDPGPHEPWGRSGRRAQDRALAGPDPAVPTVGRAAAAALLDRWVATEGGGAPLLVGLGLDEVIGLNRAARRLTTGDPRRPDGTIAALGPPDRDTFGSGTRVVVGHRLGGPARYGSFGTIRPGSTGPVVRWDDDRLPDAPLDDRLRRSLRPGWAVTPYLAARSDQPLLVLGPADAAGLARSRALASIERPTEVRARSLDR